MGGVSAIGQIRAVMEGRFGQRIAQENPHIAESYVKLFEIARHLVGGLPIGDPAAVISKWRLEKPLEPVLPELTSEEMIEANRSCGKSIYDDPGDFLKVLEQQSPEHAKTFEILVDFAKNIKDAGGRVLLVGGGVRDMRTNIILKDFDIEIYGLPSEKIVEIAKGFGPVNEVGSSFAVRKVRFETGMDIDLAIPRIDSQATPDHQDVQVLPDPNMPIREACRRRDFTINAMAADILTGELFDFFGGDEDLKNGILRVTDERLFCDDSLRVLRGLQFIGRQGLVVDSRTEEIMRLMVFELGNVAKDRFREEWSKLLLKSKIPSLGLMKAAQIGLFKELYPDFHKLIQTKQDPKWHAEGGVWMHTLISTDRAAQVVAREGLGGDEALAIMLAALGHDLGKPQTTQEYPDGRITSVGHAQVGKEPMLAFLEQNGFPLKLSKKVAVLVEKHMEPVLLYGNEIVHGQDQRNAVRRLMENLAAAGASIEDLVLVSEADQLGRFYDDDPGVLENLNYIGSFPAGRWLIDKSKGIELKNGKPAEILSRASVSRVAKIFGGGPHIAQIKTFANRLHDSLGMGEDQILVEIQKSIGVDVKPELRKTIDHMEALLK